MKKITITTSKAKIIYGVLDKGMPDSKIKQDKVAKIWFKLKQVIKK